jgi:hypothetical protein
MMYVICEIIGKSQDFDPINWIFQTCIQGYLHNTLVAITKWN